MLAGMPNADMHHGKQKLSISEVHCCLPRYFKNVSQVAKYIGVAEHPLCPDFLTRIQSLVLVDN